MLLDIVILPPEGIRKKIGTKARKATDDLLCFFVVDNVRLVPHLSLWHLRTSKTKIYALAEELRRTVKEQKPIRINSTWFRALKEYKGDVEFGIKGNRALSRLQKRVFTKACLYKTGMMPPSIGSWSGKALAEAKRYGRPLGFEPHFTMGFLKKEKDALKVVKRMGEVKFHFIAREIYICEVNEWWQVKRIIKKIGFG